MLLISHLYTANRIKDQAKPKDDSVYYTNSILPDIRYTASIKREKTHLALSQLKKVFNKNSDEYKGYCLHILIDEFMGEWDFLGKLKAKYPKLIHGVLKTSLLNVIVEIYCLEKMKKSSQISLSKKYNDDYKKLGINGTDFSEYMESIQAIVDDYSIESMESILLSDKKLKDIKKVQLYRRIGKFISKNRLIKWYLTNKVDSVYKLFLNDLSKKYLSNL